MNALTQQHHKARPGCFSLADKLLEAGVQTPTPASPQKEKVVNVAQKPSAKPVVKKQAERKAKAVTAPASRKPQAPQVPHTFIHSGKDLDAIGHNAMQHEMHLLNVATEQAEAVKPAKKATKKPVVKKASQAPHAKQAEKREQKKAPAFPAHEVPVPANREYVIIFECHKKQALACGDIQIGASSGGGKSPTAGVEQATVSRTHHELVRVDMVTFDRHCTISGINVLAIPGSSSLCRVFVNFKSAKNDSAKHWGEGTDYEKFLSRLLFGRKWDAASIKDDAGKTTITLKKPDPDPKGAAKLLLAFRE